MPQLCYDSGGAEAAPHSLDVHGSGTTTGDAAAVAVVFSTKLLIPGAINSAARIIGNRSAMKHDKA